MPLVHHLALWGMIFRAAHENLIKKTMTGVPSDKVPAQALADILTNGRYELLAAFDPTQNAQVHPPVPWAHYLVWELKNFRTQTDQILDAYAAFLSPEELETIEACLHSTLMVALPQLLQVQGAGKALHPFYVIEEDKKQVASFVGEHLTKVRELVEMLNRSLETKDRIQI